MALAIDTTPLAQLCIPELQTYLDKRAGFTGRFQVYRVCAHATIIHDASTARRLSVRGRVSGNGWAKREALDWQADQDDDLDEVEVFHHLNHQAKTSPLFAELLSQTERTDVTTILVTSGVVQSPSLTASAPGSPLSSFHHYSVRESIYCISNEHSETGLISVGQHCVLPVVISTVTAPNDPWIRLQNIPLVLKIRGASSEGSELPAVAWQLQFDFVDLLSERIVPTSRPGKRRRTTLNPFHQVSPAPLQDSSRELHHLPEPKRFKGVRYRPDRRTWVAEMKPPKYKNKVSFGEFKSQAQAARVVDAAFHYYGKPHLNFSDTPRILSIRPMSPAALGEEDKLRFVKEQGKWLASMDFILPSSPPSAPSEIPESSSRGCTPGTLGFRSFSEISSSLCCGDADEWDNGIYQPEPSLHPEQMAALIEPNLVTADVAGAVMDASEERQGMIQWNLEDVLVDPCLSGVRAPSSSVLITDGWDDGAELDSSTLAALSNFVNSAQPNCKSQGSWINSLVMSPPAAMIPMPPSPSNFQCDAAHALLEQESFRGEWLSG